MARAWLPSQRNRGLRAVLSSTEDVLWEEGSRVVAGKDRLSRDQAHGCRHSLITLEKLGHPCLELCVPASLAQTLTADLGSPQVWYGTSCWPFSHLSSSSDPLPGGCCNQTTGSRLASTSYPWLIKKASQNEQWYKRFQHWMACGVHVPSEVCSDCFSVNSNELGY